MMVLLMFMLAPALFTVLFAGRSFVFLLWNMFWFWVLAVVAEGAFDTPRARFLGVFFAFWYLWRALTRPQVSEKIIFRNTTFRSSGGPQPWRRPTNSRAEKGPVSPDVESDQGQLPRDVIDADFTVN